MNIKNEIAGKMPWLSRLFNYDDSKTKAVNQKYHQYVSTFGPDILHAHYDLNHVKKAVTFSSPTNPNVVVIVEAVQNEASKKIKDLFPYMTEKVKPFNKSLPVKDIKSFPLQATKIVASTDTIYDLSSIAKNQNVESLKTGPGAYTFGFEKNKPFLETILLFYKMCGQDMNSVHVNDNYLSNNMANYVKTTELWFYHITYHTEQNIIMPYVKTRI